MQQLRFFALRWFQFTEQAGQPASQPVSQAGSSLYHLWVKVMMAFAHTYTARELMVRRKDTHTHMKHVRIYFPASSFWAHANMQLLQHYVCCAYSKMYANLGMPMPPSSVVANICVAIFSIIDFYLPLT